ncbi:MAG: chromosomal replication initiator protein DnaA [Opitutus sp.]|nr:chromosomal replication initiator protein DnaA [Opitutus sp.]MCS6248517.1 chromosomal replication initiator protein DnaA [Opitutus sp.]MCS6274704.1 chromosomal replication initiator protein DnaA [Opitutus sp.]MCS6276323.1 chromosomal replication initiator protein DnaA [Opitutus sp.]MCS6302029.1 chromosomal replication initiator protein DnaA [Opitutus sp.]
MPPVTTSTSLWEIVKSDFKGLFPEDVYQLWFEPIICLEATEDALTLGVPNDFAAIWINDNYLDLIVQRLRLAAGRAVTVKLKKSTAATDSSSAASETAPSPRTKPAAAKRTARYDERGSGAYIGSLNPRNTFETFVVGSNCQMAHAAAMAVAQSPAQAYNPLFLYGDTGLGKTHLMHAIGHAILRAKPDAKVAYLSTEKFTNDFIQALQENSLTKFRQRYRSVDVLLIDDVQFLAGKERIQEEFFHTFNDLFESGKQIILSSDRRAADIQKLEARLVSRFEWGLPADIQAPDFETRLAILRTKAATLKFDIPANVANFVALHISKNIRRLEGALIKVASYASLTGKVIDLPATEMLLQDVLMEQAQNQLTIEIIQKRVADHYQIRHSDMTSKRRPNNIAIPRQIAMYLSRTLTKHSLQEIGDAFGGRDHGTVIHACKSVDNMMEQDSTARGAIEFLRNQLSR